METIRWKVRMKHFRVIEIVLTPITRQLWKIYREECFTEYMPDQQWKFVSAELSNPEETPVFVDLGFLVSPLPLCPPPPITFHISIALSPRTYKQQQIHSQTQVSSKYGTEETKAAVDYAIYGPKGEVIQSELGVHEGEFGGHTKGGRGPWKVCFRVASGALLRPSVTVQINYFYINYDEFLHEGFDWENDEEQHKIDPKDLGTKEQIESLQHGLLRLDHYLLNVTHEQRYLYSRTLRHLRTAESTLRRTFWYYIAIYSAICLASFSQLVAVRLMFKKSRKQGLII